MFYRPAILRIFGQDLHLAVEPLQRLDAEHDPGQIANGIRPILAYLGDQNPHIFTYRFGLKEGAGMEAGLQELYALARWAAARGAPA